MSDTSHATDSGDRDIATLHASRIEFQDADGRGVAALSGASLNLIFSRLERLEKQVAALQAAAAVAPGPASAGGFVCGDAVPRATWEAALSEGLTVVFDCVTTTSLSSALFAFSAAANNTKVKFGNAGIQALSFSALGGDAFELTLLPGEFVQLWKLAGATTWIVCPGI